MRPRGDVLTLCGQRAPLQSAQVRVLNSTKLPAAVFVQLKKAASAIPPQLRRNIHQWRQGAMEAGADGPQQFGLSDGELLIVQHRGAQRLD